MDASAVFYASYAVLWAVVFLQALVLVGLIRHVFQANEPTRTQQERRLAPPIQGVDTRGGPVDSQNYIGLSWAVLFVSPSCTSCYTTVAELKALSRKAEGRLLMVCRGSAEDCSRFVEQETIDFKTVADVDDRISRAYAVTAVPIAALVDPDGYIQTYGYPERDELRAVFDGQESEQLASTMKSP
jgi:peroxiredoxin